MKMKIRFTCVVAACAAFEVAAMPTKEETANAMPVVQKLLASENAALKSGKKTRSEVADAAMKLAGEADTDAAKLLLMKGAFVLYVRDGNLDKAVASINALERTILDLPPQSVTNMIEVALIGVTKKDDRNRLYQLLDATKVVKSADGEWMYKVVDGAVVLVGKGNPDDRKSMSGAFAIPATIDGMPVTSIGSGAFQHCTRLRHLTIPAGVRHIDADAFSHCTGLRSVRMSGERPEIAGDPFRGSDIIQAVHVPADAKSWSGMKAWHGIPLVFDGKKETVGGNTWSYHVYKGVSTIEAPKNGVFVCAVSPNPVGTIAIPATLGGVKMANIGREAFAGCGELKAVAIPEGVESIGFRTFYGCANLESVTLTPSVRHVLAEAFAGCTSLKSINVVKDGKVESVPLDEFLKQCAPIPRTRFPRRSSSARP